MNTAAQAQSQATGSRRVLIVEDEVLIAMVLEDVLDLLGHRVVGTPSTYAEADAAIAAGGFDLAILDVNLGNDPVFPLADKLQESGVAIIFATGSHRDSLPSRFANAPVLEKPYAVQAVETALGELA
ncbi:response regulator [Glacieibacterium megasporae]|uniref:response regulator n=1 Tax=Glacieibacterium megasporae TaxID=2835787 RepID=UPI001C1E7A8B|nr:response regulator [Polymorphobacter megasporae]UAJ09467.1 response regulator [Polymorphobacter megasporae]